MKILRKINKGFILTVIVLVVLSIYLINLEKQRETDKKEIEKACEQYIEFTNKYVVLPEENQKLTQQISDTELNKYKEELEAKLKEQMIDNKDAVDLQYQILVSTLEGNFSKNSIVTNISRTITDKPKYEFDGDQVQVTFTAKLSKTEKYLENGDDTEEDAKTRSNTQDTYNDQINLQKVDGKWKIVYSNLQFYSSVGPSTGIIYM